MLCILHIGLIICKKKFINDPKPSSIEAFRMCHVVFVPFASTPRTIHFMSCWKFCKTVAESQANHKSALLNDNFAFIWLMRIFLPCITSFDIIIKVETFSFSDRIFAFLQFFFSYKLKHVHIWSIHFLCYRDSSKSGGVFSTLLCVKQSEKNWCGEC